MAKKGKLFVALDAHKGRDYTLEKQRKLQKAAERKKRKRQEAEALNGQANEELEDQITQGTTAEHEKKEVKGNTEGISKKRHDEATQSISKTGTNGALPEVVRSSAPDDEVAENDAKEDDWENEEECEEEPEIEDDEEADIPLSDIDSLASSEKGDLLPFQRLTINNTTALLSAHKSIALPPSLPFSAHQTLTTSTPVEIPDVDDDLTRELAFYRQCLEGAEKGRQLLEAEGVPFSRPNDYFAEMAKSDEHMGKIKAKMVGDAARKKASGEAKRQRNLKKFGKQVQVAKEQERAKAKRATLDKIDLLKRKRKNTDIGATNEEDLFDVALEDASKEHRGGRNVDNAGNATRGNKRQKKNDKFGFGGKKRFKKSGDALSSGDVSGYSAKGMKGGERGKTKRLGKSRRAKQS